MIKNFKKKKTKKKERSADLPNIASTLIFRRL